MKNDLKELRRLTTFARDQMVDAVVKIPPEELLHILDQVDAWKAAAEKLDLTRDYVQPHSHNSPEEYEIWEELDCECYKLVKAARELEAAGGARTIAEAHSSLSETA